MEIERAADSGFCFGVRRAIEIVEKAVQKEGRLKTLGPVVHNRQVVERLEASGIEVATDWDNLGCDVVAIASHGVAPLVLERLKSRGIRVVDATCPFVRRAQQAAQRLREAGFYVLLFGDVAHPEVQGILGGAGDSAMATLEVPDWEKPPRRVGILSQTTQSPDRFARFLEQFIAPYMASVSELRIINTICDATARRQQAALKLARRVELMIVIGGHHSANTRHLAQSCAAVVETHHIETAAELDPIWLRNRSRVGVTAGASTPDWVIDEVIAKLGQIGKMV